jgi:hypothetical protein
MILSRRFEISMEQDKSFRMLLRQLKDVQAQANKILSGDDSEEAIENFSKYSIEMKSYILKNVESQEIKSYMAELPEIKYSASKVKLWEYFVLFILPTWWITLYRNYQAKSKAKEEINIVKGKYATLELLIKGLYS